jgi:hypothetical protein
MLQVITLIGRQNQSPDEDQLETAWNVSPLGVSIASTVMLSAFSLLPSATIHFY